MSFKHLKVHQILHHTSRSQLSHHQCWEMWCNTILLICNCKKKKKNPDFSVFARRMLRRSRNQPTYSYLLFLFRTTFRVIPPNPKKQIQLALWGNKGTSIVSLSHFLWCLNYLHVNNNSLISSISFHLCKKTSFNFPHVVLSEKYFSLS